MGKIQQGQTFWVRVDPSFPATLSSCSTTAPASVRQHYSVSDVPRALLRYNTFTHRE